jgi:hypothetical protein
MEAMEAAAELHNNMVNNSSQSFAEALSEHVKVVANDPV